MSIGIAIPTYKGHIEFLPRLLDSIAESTVLPNEVSVSVSEVDDIPEVLLKEYPFILNVAINKNRRNPAQNTNTALRMLNTDILSIIGSDDMVHPQRNEFILKAFDNPKVNVVVHNILQSDVVDKDFFDIRYNDIDLLVDYIDTVTINSIHPISSMDDTIGFHNAMVSFKREIFDKFKYNENKSFIYIEDSLFTRELVKDGYHLSYIPHKLALYLKNPNR